MGQSGGEREHDGRQNVALTRVMSLGAKQTMTNSSCLQRGLAPSSLRATGPASSPLVAEVARLQDDVRRLESALRMRDHASALVLHELRQPLSALMIASAQLAKAAVGSASSSSSSGADPITCVPGAGGGSSNGGDCSAEGVETCSDAATYKFGCTCTVAVSVKAVVASADHSAAAHLRAIELRALTQDANLLVVQTLDVFGGPTGARLRVSASHRDRTC
jgi:signal transduction histidine kinase